MSFSLKQYLQLESLNGFVFPRLAARAVRAILPNTLLVHNLQYLEEE